MKTYGERVLLVGDAARQVKAFSGGGIYLSLVAAGYAAETAVQALAEDNLSEASLARYQAHWEAELGVELRRGAEIRQLYVSLSQNQLDRLLQVLSFPLLRRITALQGDIDFPSPMFSALLRTAPALKWVLGLSHMPKWNGD
jgi:flavin-dependent dehydrogenase